MKEMEMIGLLLKLADLGITGVRVEYEGSGDSGAIELITYTKEPCETIDNVSEHTEVYGSESQLQGAIDITLYNSLENFLYDTLLQDIEDWYNNDGGYGVVYIHVLSGEYKIDNHQRYTQYHDYQHEGKLIEKTND